MAEAAAPERIVLAVGQNAVCIKADQREHPRIPACGNQRNLAAALCSGIDCGKMFRDFRVGVETVHDIEESCILGSLLGKIRGASAAQNQDIDLIGPLSELSDANDRNAGCLDGQRCRIATGKNSSQAHVAA